MNCEGQQHGEQIDVYSVYENGKRNKWFSKKVRVNCMSFEDELRKQSRQINYSDRDRLLRETAKKCVPDFKKACESRSRLGYNTCSKAAGYYDGVTRLVYAVPDERYEVERTQAMASIILRNDIYIRMSEAETFQQYLREELDGNGLERVSIQQEECVLEYRKTGFFGSRQVRDRLWKYKFVLFLSW